MLSFDYFQTYIFDNPFLRSRCSQFINHYFKHREVKYKTIEREITENPDWPPVKSSSDVMGNGYMRLDSINSNGDGNLLYTSDSEAEVKSLTSSSSLTKI